MVPLLEAPAALMLTTTRRASEAVWRTTAPSGRVCRFSGAPSATRAERSRSDCTFVEVEEQYQLTVEGCDAVTHAQQGIRLRVLAI